MRAVAEVLRAARAKIEKPEHWTQGVLSRDANGTPSFYAAAHTKAVCWCASGAIFSAAGESDPLDALDAFRSMINGSIPQFNDTHTHAEVLAAFDKAIAAAEATP